MVELGGKPIPKTFEPFLIEIRDRISQLKEKFGSLSKWGRPYFYSVKEIAIVYYLNSKLNISLDRLAGFFNVDKTALYKLVRKIEENNEVSYFDPQENTVKTVKVTPEQLIQLAEGEIETVSKQKITDPFQSNIIKKFIENPIPKRSKIAGKPTLLSDSDKRDTLRVVKKLIDYFNSKDMISNPDFWDQQTVETALWEIYNNDPKKVMRAKILLRRIPEFSSWFKGSIGAVTKYIDPKLSVLFYKDYLKIKELYKQNAITEGEFIVIWLHITTGSREGYTLYTPSQPLDDPNVNSSLIGLRFENMTKVGDTYIIKIYESKTNKTWTCDLSWLDNEALEIFLKYSREKGNIVKSLLGVETVGEFVKKYTSLLKRISKLLNLPYTLKPHDLRRSHISILAELGIPLEYAVSGHFDFGVGWEDLKTAVYFYLRFSRYTKEILKKQMETRKKEIISTL